MHENTQGSVTFFINLVFSRLEKFDGSRFEGAYIQGAYIWDVDWIKYLGDLYTGGILTGFYCVEKIIFLEPK